jgi:hypothetical protein
LIALADSAMGDAAARLAEYRLRRREEEQTAARSEAVWSTLTLQPLRRRLAARLEVAPEDHRDEAEGEEMGEEEEEPVPWSRLDWAILAMKLLIYGCLQILFIKLEFGAVFFLGSGVVALWWSLEDRKR